MTGIGRADIEEASRAVDVSSRARQLCYPRGNFSVVTVRQKYASAVRYANLSIWEKVLLFFPSDHLLPLHSM